MQIDGLTFVGTRTVAPALMTAFVREVLGLTSSRVEGLDAEMFALPDGSWFAVTASEGAADAERTIGFRVANLDEALAELRVAGVSVDGEVSTSSTQRYVHFRPPDGHLYELVEDIG